MYTTASEFPKSSLPSEITSVAFVHELFSRIDAVEPKVKAFLSIDPEDILKQAAASDAAVPQASP
jgi:Asp-tRNA(Asn)/Glu-tRNA(Gln) amidotransferase A subunit family amidase